ncbi:hypothetical protein [Streptomyces sp. WP-1]|uniref:hypothetical protein n=1 Tax=Streptomyces sp. WP-1 TaxID=3041497 RepID=UPI002648FCA9|nr:hypothetical protein [Streptomyces sp. WP-1]WKE70841.1 hypothetical protein QHG49_18250 [Streptomyces sp. WP-1]
MLRRGTLRTTTWSPGRRRALAGASAAVVCLGAALGACAGAGGGGGHVAVGGAGRPGPVDARPTGSVTMVPLDGPGGGGTTPPGTTGSPPGTTGTPPAGAGSGPDPARADGSPVPSTPGPPSPNGSSTGMGTGADDGRTTHTPAPPAPAPAPTTPAALSWGAPVTADGDQRWCQEVTVSFRNSGGTAVRSGSVTFGTHVIGALGIDWSTVRTSEALPVPIGAGARTDHTWTVCLDAWRVPLGMHIETRDVAVQWK